MVVAVQTGSMEEIQEDIAPAVSAKVIGNHLLAARLRSNVSLARLTLTLQHRQA